MTDRLSVLLQREAEAVPAPAPDAEAILRQGRVLRRRRRGAEGVAALVVCGCLVATGLYGFSDRRSADQRRYDAAPAGAAYSEYGAFAVGSTVYVGNHETTFDDKVKAIYYTSAGVVVRHGRRATTDEPGPSYYTLVRPDGTRSELDLQLGDRLPGTSPESRYLAYAAPGADARHWELVAFDLEANREVARREVPGVFTWGGWVAPPATTADTTLWALFDDGWHEWNWSTGATRVIQGARGELSVDAGGGRYVRREVQAENAQGERPEVWHVIDFSTGRAVAAHDVGTRGAWLSPNGRTLRIDEGYAGYDENDRLVDYPNPSTFIDLDSGQAFTVEDQALYGWTPDGRALAVDPGSDEVRVCSVIHQRCQVVDRDIKDGKVKLGGLLYES